MSTGGKNCWGKPVTDKHLIRFGGRGLGVMLLVASCYLNQVNLQTHGSSNTEVRREFYLTKPNSGKKEFC